MNTIYQIYYDQKSRDNCLSWATPIDNPHASVYLENDVIIDLVSKYEGNAIAVCSHKLLQKMPNNPYTVSGELFTQEYIDKQMGKYDILFLQRHPGSTHMLQSMENWHPGSKFMLQELFRGMGFDFNVDQQLKHVVYSNHVMARTDIYKEYVGFLIHARNTMNEMGELFFTDSGYTTLAGPLPDNLKDSWGIDFWPMHPFICERLWSIWLQDKNYKICLV